jgi:hypothetical protein
MGCPSYGGVARRGSAWTYGEIASGHDTMVAEPQLIAELLLDAAGSH